MGAKHVTPEEIIKMKVLYQQYGTYEAVAKIVGRSGSTVSKYVQMNDFPQNIKIAMDNLINSKRED